MFISNPSSSEVRDGISNTVVRSMVGEISHMCEKLRRKKFFKTTFKLYHHKADSVQFIIDLRIIKSQH